LDSVNEGDTVPENYLTDTRTLRPLIDKYNSYCKVNYNELKIDANLADIRNALVHGRVLSKDSNFLSIQLFNFERDAERQIKVTFIALLTKEWFATQIKKFLSAASNVHKRIKSEFPDVVGEMPFK
jgi:hypothetical protein